MKQRLFKTVADLRFAILILLLIAFFSIIGTIIEQDQSIEIYKLNYPLTNPIFGIISWDIILKFGLDHVYKTWWFILTIVLFGLSLLTCTILQQVPVLKISRRCQFFRTSQQFQRLKSSTKLKNVKFNNLLSRIKHTDYSVFHQKNILYAYKGLSGRIAPIIVHFSIILILLGTIVGSINGFKAQEIIPKTEIFHIQNILNNGQITQIPKVTGRINDFWITYTKQKTISQFYSDLSILNIDGNEIKRKTIYVNSPARYRGLNFYQTDWNLIGLRIKNEHFKCFQYPLINFGNSQNKIWITWISESTNLNNGFVLLIDNLQGYCSIYNETGEFLGNFELHEPLDKKLPIILVDILSSTGLQIKTDPGIPFIYTGFFFLIFSTLISYVTYSQIWLINDNKKLFIGGTTTRAIFDFEIEFLKIIKI
jgi:cytochrome c biogenesis protein